MSGDHSCTVALKRNKLPSAAHKISWNSMKTLLLFVSNHFKDIVAQWQAIFILFQLVLCAADGNDAH